MSQSRSVHGLPGKWRTDLVVALLQSALLFGSAVVPLTDAVKLQLDEKMELQRSAARYRQYFVKHDTWRELLQVDDKQSKVWEETGNNEEQHQPSKEEETVNMEKQQQQEQQPSRQEETMNKEKGETYFLLENPYKIGVSVQDWDEKRSSWLDRNRHLKSIAGGKPQVLIVTGSQPGPCKSREGDHFHLKALKNKIDYARMHNFQIYNNLVFLDPLLTGVWAKLPIARNLLLTHPEIEWVMWVDSDALFTDMLFEIPFETYDDYNLVMWAWEAGYQKRDWVAVNDGVFLLRNCQWSLDLFDKWSPMGKDGKVKQDAGEMLSSFLTNRHGSFPADDQSALMYVMLTDEAVMNKVKLVDSEYLIHGYWVDIVENFEEYMEKYHPGLGDCRWPFTTHFTGCSPCSGGNNPNYSYETCMKNFNRAFNFADNQVLAYMGFQHKSLSSSEVVSIWNETAGPLETPILLGISPWSERIAQVAAPSESRPGCCGAQRC